MSRTVLFVDDEENILRSLRRCFFDSKIIVHYALGAEEAYAILSVHKIDMVVSDMRMPNVDGYELLSCVKEKYPHIVRIFLSGYSDKGQLLKTLSNGIVKAYLYKPWDNDELIARLEHYFSLYENLQEDGIEQVINRISTLPVLSSTYQKFFNLVKNQAELGEIARTIETNAPYTANLLKLANSAIYSLSTSSVKQALVCLGVVVAKDIIMSTEVFNVLRVNGTILENEYDTFVKHSEISNIVFHQLYRLNYGQKVPEEFETVCLLHDIGKLVILHFFPEQYEEVIKRRESEPEKSILEIEAEVIGVSHAQIGAYLIDWWDLPLALQEVALYHHTPDSQQVLHKELMKIVFLADEVAGKVLNQSKELLIPDSILETLKLSHEQVLQVLEQSIE